MEFKKVDFNLLKGEENSNYRKEIVEKVLDSKVVQQFMKENNLDESIVDANLAVLLRFAEENECCLNCKSIYECPKDVKGYQASLNISYGRFFEIEYVPCKYQLEFTKKISNYIYHDFEDYWVDAKLDKLVINNYRKLVIKKCVDLIGGKMKSLYIHGKTGVGKSYISAATLNEYIFLTNNKVAFVNAKKIIDSLRNLLYEKLNDDYDVIKHNLLDVSFLVIDDIGNEKITDWSKEEIYDIIDARYQKGLLTIFTSDYSIDELKELYGKKDLKNRKLFSRLESYSTEIELLGIQVK